MCHFRPLSHIMSVECRLGALFAHVEDFRQYMFAFQGLSECRIYKDRISINRNVTVDRSTLESKLEAAVTELNELRKIIDNLHQSSEEALNNASDRRRSVVENCRILIKEVIAGDVADTFI